MMQERKEKEIRFKNDIQHPLVSIITVVLNGESHLEDTINSVLSQTYENLEYIIIDGGSTDRTNEIIDSYSDNISKHISEPDEGIYDAMNKGISHSTGDLIGILNSDDYYNDNRVIEKIVQVFENHKTDSIYANIDYVSPNQDGKIIRKWISGPFKENSFRKGWHPAHPGFFVKKEIFQEFGLYDLSYKIAADFELMLRFLEKHKITNYYFPESIINMRLGGASNKNLWNILKGNKECYRAFRKNKLKVSFVYPLFRLVPKVFQFIN
jgi:glycosyltransferase involved in cell wall biosynthesis